jgi:hypothetical protein
MCFCCSGPLVPSAGKCLRCMYLPQCIPCKLKAIITRSGTSSAMQVSTFSEVKVSLGKVGGHSTHRLTKSKFGTSAGFVFGLKTALGRLLEVDWIFYLNATY